MLRKSWSLSSALVASLVLSFWGPVRADAITLSAADLNPTARQITSTGIFNDVHYNAATGETIYVGAENVGGFGVPSTWVVDANGTVTQTIRDDKSGLFSAINGVGSSYTIVGTVGDVRDQSIGLKANNADLSDLAELRTHVPGNLIEAWAVSEAGRVVGVTGGAGSYYKDPDGAFLGLPPPLGGDNAFGVSSDGTRIAGDASPGALGSGFFASAWKQSAGGSGYDVAFTETVGNSFSWDIEGDILVGDRLGQAGYWDITSGDFFGLISASSDPLFGSILAIDKSGWFGGYLYQDEAYYGFLSHTSFAVNEWILADTFFGLDPGTVVSINGIKEFDGRLYLAGQGSGWDLQFDNPITSSPAIPEPATGALALLGIGFLATRRGWRERRQ